jgi:hypothetical protein
MLRKIGIGLACAVGAYVFGALGGALLVSTLSSNVHDRSLEAVMTGAFVTGPLAAAIGLVAGLAWPRRGQAGQSRDKGD